MRAVAGKDESQLSLDGFAACQHRRGRAIDQGGQALLQVGKTVGADDGAMRMVIASARRAAKRGRQRGIAFHIGVPLACKIAESRLAVC